MSVLPSRISSTLHCNVCMKLNLISFNLLSYIVPLNM